MMTTPRRVDEPSSGVEADMVWCEEAADIDPVQVKAVMGKVMDTVLENTMLFGDPPPPPSVDLSKRLSPHFWDAPFHAPPERCDTCLPPPPEPQPYFSRAYAKRPNHAEVALFRVDAATIMQTQPEGLMLTMQFVANRNEFVLLAEQSPSRRRALRKLLDELGSMAHAEVPADLIGFAGSTVEWIAKDIPGLDRATVNQLMEFIRYGRANTVAGAAQLLVDPAGREFLRRPDPGAVRPPAGRDAGREQPGDGPARVAAHDAGGAGGRGGASGVAHLQPADDGDRRGDGGPAPRRAAPFPTERVLHQRSGGHPCIWGADPVEWEP